ncbi:MAG: hypothetical protein JNK14_12870 [Chitinophagaceae bacterium]|nr:hypothetical protein [Chitinophagaceae bacterium]
MKRILIVIVILSVVAASCKKEDNTGPGIIGRWKLVSVTDKVTNTTYFKPAGYNRDIKLTFTASSVSGQTGKNILSGGQYSFQNGTDLVFGTIGSTFVNEDEWGSMFLTVLYACGLQSVYPCAPSKVTFLGPTMKIESPLRYDLVLARY